MTVFYWYWPSSKLVGILVVLCFLILLGRDFMGLFPSFLFKFLSIVVLYQLLSTYCLFFIGVQVQIHRSCTECLLLITSWIYALTHANVTMVIQSQPQQKPQPQRQMQYGYSKVVPTELQGPNLSPVLQRPHCYIIYN